MFGLPILVLPHYFTHFLRFLTTELVNNCHHLNVVVRSRITQGFCSGLVCSWLVVSVSKGSGLPGCSPGLEPDQMIWSGLLPRNQGNPAGSGTGSNRTTVPFYGPYNLGCNSVFEFSLYRNLIYTWNVQIDALFHLPFSDLRWDQYSLSRFEIKLKITPK